MGNSKEGFLYRGRFCFEGLEMGIKGEEVREIRNREIRNKYLFRNVV